MTNKYHPILGAPMRETDLHHICNSISTNLQPIVKELSWLAAEREWALTARRSDANNRR